MAVFSSNVAGPTLSPGGARFMIDSGGGTGRAEDAPRNRYRDRRRDRLFEPGARAASALAAPAAVADRLPGHARRSGSMLSGRAPLLRERDSRQHAHPVVSADQPAKDQPRLPRRLAKIRAVTSTARAAPRRSPGAFS